MDIINHGGEIDLKKAPLEVFVNSAKLGGNVHFYLGMYWIEGGSL